MHVSVHVVRPGETLHSIARAYSVDAYHIAMANHLVNPHMVFAGQRLVVPGGYGYMPPQYVPMHPGQVYAVQPGDTLFSIAMRFGTSVNAIAMANNIRNPNVIFAGQRLVIPGGKPGYYAPPYQPPSYTPPYQQKPAYDSKKRPRLKPAVCNERTKLTFPREGEILDGPGTFNIHGTASIDDFQFYKLELGVGDVPIDFFSIDEVKTKSIVNGILLRDWNTGALPEGDYILRLTVVDNSGQFPPPCDVRVRIRHPKGVIHNNKLAC
jgi:LysM repeat protein